MNNDKVLHCGANFSYKIRGFGAMDNGILDGNACMSYNIYEKSKNENILTLKILRYLIIVICEKFYKIKIYIIFYIFNNYD